ncbi:hypothetical protein HYS96_03315 [Candidatus Daviesbacteria bacterium]|nr:hypothetical protein [Candidatus Daviesbacteria bacterium]
MAGLGVEIALVQEISKPHKVLSLNGLIGVDRRTAAARLGTKEEPTRRIPFTFRGIQDLIRVAIGIDIQRPTAVVTHHLQGMNFQLIQHPRTRSILWIGNPEVSDEPFALEQATATIEIERNDCPDKPGHFTPRHLRIGTYEPNLKRPIGVAWLLRDGFDIQQIDVAPSPLEYPQNVYGVTVPEAEAERIPTDTESYARTFSAALITERMIPPAPYPLWRGILRFGGFYAFDASHLAPWGFYALRGPSQVIVGFQGGDNEFLRQLPRAVGYGGQIQRPLPSWHLAFPASLRKV